MKKAKSQTSKTKPNKKPASITKHARIVGQLGGRPPNKPASMLNG